jgi:hypothetical protein
MFGSISENHMFEIVRNIFQSAIKFWQSTSFPPQSSSWRSLLLEEPYHSPNLGIVPTGLSLRALFPWLGLERWSESPPHNGIATRDEFHVDIREKYKAKFTLKKVFHFNGIIDIVALYDRPGDVTIHNGNRIQQFQIGICKTQGKYLDFAFMVEFPHVGCNFGAIPFPHRRPTIRQGNYNRSPNTIVCSISNPSR